ncbi:MAG: hypothetical protein QM706_09465 [Nitrospira sp.]
MNNDKTGLAAPVYYKKRHIVLTADERQDGTWGCRYSIIEPGQSPLESGTGQAEGAFPSRESAELAAVQKAKAVIDL